MKFVFVALCLFAASAMGAPNSLRTLPPLLHEEIHDPSSQYHFRYVTAEKTIVEERGHLELNAEGTGYVMVVEGTVTFTAPDGKVYITHYTAGRGGFHATGDHLPKPVEPLPVVPAPAPAATA